MSPDTAGIAFTSVSDADYPRLHEWLKQEHVRRWWGDPDEEIALIKSIVDDDDGTEGFVIHLDGAPVGYIQSWRPASFDDTRWVDEAPWLRQVPRDTIGIDIFIGPADLIEKGVGPSAIRAFAQRLFDAGAPRLIIDPDAGNARAIRAYEKAGFKTFARHDGNDDSTLLMELTREDFQRIS